MSGYQGLGRIQDPATQAVCKALFDQTGALLRRIAELETSALRSGSPYEAGGNRISALGSPQALQDAVNVEYLRQYVAAQLALVSGGSGTVEVDPNGALDESPLGVRVDGSSIIINGSNALEAPGAAGGITQLTGDVTAGPGSGSEVATLAASGVSAGSYGSASLVPVLTVDAKGRVTAASTAAVSGGSSPWALVNSWTYSVDVAQVDFTGLSGYSEILVSIVAVTLSVSGLRLVRVSTDNGATFLSTSGDYVGQSSAGADSALTSMGAQDTAGTTARSGQVLIRGFNTATANKPFDRATRTDVTTGYIPTATALNAVRVLPSAGGNLTGGTIQVWGRA